MKKSLLIFHIVFLSLNLFSAENFKGYNKDNSTHSVLSLLQSKYYDHSKWNENYYHEAQFKDQGITVFTNIIFSNAFFDKKGCKINCIITFKDGRKYVFNKDYKSNEYSKDKNGFYFKFDKNYIKLINDNQYNIHIEDKNIQLELTYNIINHPFIFGDGIVNIDSNYFLGFCQPVLGAEIDGELTYKDKKYNLNGYGSINHDYGIAPPVKNPLQWRSFWLYDKNISIVIHSFTLKNGEEIDRIIINQNGNLKASFLNTGLKSYDFITDEKTNFKYPTKFKINYNDKSGNEINAVIDFVNFTDKIQAFSHLSPLVHSLAAMAVGEMWSYRFWVDAEVSLLINNKQEKIKISGLCNYIDVVK